MSPQSSRPVGSGRFEDDSLGAYGLRLAGVSEAASLLVLADPSWPLFEVSADLGEGLVDAERVGDEDASLRLRTGGKIDIERVSGRIVFTVPRPVRPDELVHPYLAPAAAVIGHWLDRESFHAGAFVSSGRSWAVVGERGAGKSSTLAALGLAGHVVVTDDMLVLRDTQPYLGPRSVDLRRDAAEVLGVGKEIGMTGARERWRLTLPPPAAPPPALAGWIFLGWGESLEAVEVPPGERLKRLFAQRGTRLPPRRPQALVELTALPAWELRRPRRWDTLEEACTRLLALVEG